MKNWVLIFGLFCCMSCSQISVFEQTFESISGDTLSLKALQKPNGQVLVFMAPVCPLCQNYSVTLNRLFAEYAQQDIGFVGVVSGSYYPPEEILAFQREYDIGFPIILDPKFQLTNELGAEITPEVVLLDSLFQKKYQGGIDNWAISLGQKRQKITAHYLSDALDAYLAGNKPKITKTKAVGCFIE